MNGWKLKQSAIGKAAADLTDSDFSPDIQQKGVDMKIGLDIAWISFNKIAERILVITEIPISSPRLNWRDVMEFKCIFSRSPMESPTNSPNIRID